MTTVRRVLASGARFSYECKGCGRCCHDKRITLSPYELARLARAAKLSTRELLERHTEEAGTALRFDEPHGCTFLDGGACRVHEGRPLACRLYPLGRIVTPEGESIVELEPHPQTEGIYGERDDPAAWFEAQGAPPFIAAAARYHELLKRMAAVLSSREGGLDDFDAALTTDSAVASDWLDVDAVVAETCAARGEPEPSDLEARIDVHLDAMNRWLDALESG